MTFKINNKNELFELHGASSRKDLKYLIFFSPPLINALNFLIIKLKTCRST